MQDLSTSDLNQVLEIGQISIGCDTIDDLHDAAITRMQKALRADTSVMINILREGQSVRFKAHKAFDHPDSEMRRWCAQYQQQDPFVNCYINEFKTRSSNVIVSNQVVRDREYQVSKFYNEFLRPMSIYHVMVVGLCAGNFPFGLIGFHRPKNAPAFSDREIAMAELMSPHIVAANQKVRVSNMMGEREQLIEMLVSDGLYNSILLLDENLTPLYVNQGASELLESINRCMSMRQNQKAAVPPALLDRCRKLLSAVEQKADTEGLLEFDLKVSPSSRTIGVSLRPVENGVGKMQVMVCLRSAETEPAFNHNTIKRFG
ncbi:MAG: hypothetical protein AB3N28_02740, partial [Kordiimonas sp.]